MILCNSMNVGLVREWLYVAKHRLEVTCQLLKLFVKAEEVLGKLSKMEVPGAELLLQRQVCRDSRSEFFAQTTGIIVAVVQ